MADGLLGQVPVELQPEVQGLNRQQQMAQMLMQQAFQQPQGQMISGRYVAPGLLQQLQPLAAAYVGTKGMEAAENKQLELAKAIRTQGDAAVTDVMETYKKDPNLGLQKALKYQDFPQVKAVIPSLAEALKPTTLEKEWLAAKNQGYTGTINDFKNQMTEAQREENRIAKARLGLAQQSQAWEMGMPVGGVGGGVSVGGAQAPLRTINPGSPILAPNQQVPTQVGTTEPMPRFRSKPEQDVWIATQKEKGRLQAEAQNALPGALQTAQTGINAINELIGDTTVDKKGNIVYGKQLPKAGFEQSVGMPTAGSLFGFTNLFPGSEAADFKAAFEQIGGQAFLGAIGTLKGTGAISEVEGAKATSALNRMKLSQSEPEFIKAANDFKEVLEKGYKAAQQRAGTAPMDYRAQPSVGGTKPKYVYNPATGTLE